MLQERIRVSLALGLIKVKLGVGNVLLLSCSEGTSDLEVRVILVVVALDWLFGTVRQLF